MPLARGRARFCAGKKEQPKQEKKYLAQAVAAAEDANRQWIFSSPAPPSTRVGRQSDRCDSSRRRQYRFRRRRRPIAGAARPRRRDVAAPPAAAGRAVCGCGPGAVRGLGRRRRRRRASDPCRRPPRSALPPNHSPSTCSAPVRPTRRRRRAAKRSAPTARAKGPVPSIRYPMSNLSRARAE